MFKKIFYYLLLSSLVGLNSGPALSASALRGLLFEASPRLAASFMPTQRLHTYVLPTYDKAFKELLHDSEVRNSLFRGLVDDKIESSEVFGLSNKNLKDQQQITIDSIGAFLKKYESFIVQYQGTHKPKGTKLDASTLVHELATKYYEPLCALFPVADKESYMDFTCHLKDGSTVLVEMQVRTEPYWNSRALAYAARIYSSQLARGQSWGKLKKVYSLNILGGYEPSVGSDVRYTWVSHAQKKPDGTPVVLKRYQLVNLHNPADKIADLEIIQAFPQLFEGGTAGLKALGINDVQALAMAEWLELFKEAQMKTKTYVEQHVTDPGVKKAYSILEKPELADNYKEWREKFGPAYADNIVQEAAAAKEEGEQIGLEKGKVEVARSMKIEGITAVVIKKCTGLSLEDIEKL